jgi:hypothetical protein
MTLKPVSPCHKNHYLLIVNKVIERIPSNLAMKLLEESMLTCDFSIIRDSESSDSFCNDQPVQPCRDGHNFPRLAYSDMSKIIQQIDGHLFKRSMWAPDPTWKGLLDSTLLSWHFVLQIILSPVDLNGSQHEAENYCIAVILDSVQLTLHLWRI